MRINKLLSNYGICSRKDTVKLIEDKRLVINGELCKQGQWVEENDIILLDDIIIKKEESIYIAFYKPRGIECTRSKKSKENIIDLINYKKYIFPIGRLDKDSEGLILLTNDGEFANFILEGNNEKEYVVTLDRPYEDDFLIKMREGVIIHNKESTGFKRIGDKKYIKEADGETVFAEEVYKSKQKGFVKTKECKVERISTDTFKIILMQGMNRQIRKMCKTLGFEVIKLKRVRIASVELEELKVGSFRKLNRESI